MKIAYAVLLCALFGSLCACTAKNSATTSTQSAAPAETASADAESTASPLPSPESSASPAATPVAYTDLKGTVGADKIEQVSALGVFDTINGSKFEPLKLINRREFVRWTYNANNAIESDSNKQIHPASPGEKSAFKDFSSNDKDFPIIEGMQDAGISVGFPDKTFKPDIPITREQAVAIADAINCDYSGNWSKTPNEAYPYLPAWKDKSSVSKIYAPILGSCELDGSVTSGIVSRAYGKIALFRPQTPVTRSEAALMLWKVRTRDASQAVASSSASASP